MRLPDFEAWAIFATVAETGSFTGAADMLGLSKASVSKAVSRLEAQLGTVLFHRTSRRISLSSAGRGLLGNAQRIRAEGEAAIEAARDEAQLLAGTVRLAAPMSFGLRSIGPVVAKFMADHPGITIDLHLSDEHIDIVDQGFDLALRIAALPDSSLRIIRLRSVLRHIVAAPDYLDRHGRPQRPEDLKNHWGFIYSNLADPDHWHLTGPDGRWVTVQPKAALRANNSDVILPALINGRGIAILPDFMCDDALGAGKLETLLPQWRMEEIALNIVTPPSSHRPARVEALISFLKLSLAG